MASFDMYLVNLELIPYHSEGITLPSKLSKPQLEYIKRRFETNLNFIIQFRPNYLSSTEIYGIHF
jgi:hypothetical protein